MKLYIVNWGFYSCNDSGSEWHSIWTNEDDALKAVKRDQVDRRLRPKGKIKNLWTDGDYWIGVTEIEANTDYPYGGTTDAKR